MDLTVLFLAVPKLSAALRPTATQLLWITDVYGFLIAGSLVLMGSLGDRVGRRRVLLIGAAAFGAASLLAAVSSSPEMLIAARALQGLAGATLVPSIMALAFSLFADERQRAAAIGALMGCFALGAAVGPLLGGVLLHFFGWGSVFVPNVPVMALLLVLGPRVLPESRNPAAGRIDLSSAALSLLGILAVVYAIKQSAQNGIELAPTAVGVVGLALLAVFVRRQGRIAEPLLDIAMLRGRTFSTALSANVVSAFVMYGIFFFTSQYLQLVADLSPLKAGLFSLPPVAALMVGSALVPKLVVRIRPGYLVAGGLAVCAAGFLLLIGVGAHGSLGLLVAALVVIHVGIAPGTALGTNLIVGVVAPHQSGAASGVAQTGNELGGALGIALLGALGTALYRHGLAGHAAPAAAHNTLGGAVGLGHRLAPQILHAADLAFMHGLHVVAATCAVLLTGMALATAVLLRHVPPIGADTPSAEPSLGNEAVAPVAA
jgi:DHA2 family multidrug resistance protein-like MFS transporter